MNMCPGACVITSGGLLEGDRLGRHAAGPEDGLLAAEQRGRLAPVGLITSAMPMSAGSPMWTGAPWAIG